MLHPSRVPISNFKIKRVSKVYHVIYNNRLGGDTISKCQRTEESTSNLPGLLYWFHITTYSLIDSKLPIALVVQFYRLIQFHIRRLPVRVSNSGQPVTYSKQYFKNKTCLTLYRCMSAGSTQHYTLISTPTIIHRKAFFAPACRPRKKNCHILHCCTHARFTCHRPLLNVIQKYISSNQIIFLFVKT